MSDINQISKEIVGRLAERPYQIGDPLPAVGSLCLVSGANCDVASDQHRSYSWRKVIGYANDKQFVCLQTRDCWPTVERVANCWFAEVPTPEPRPDAEALAAVPVLKAARALVLYFPTDADRDEFVSLIHEVKPGMRTVKL